MSEETKETPVSEAVVEETKETLMEVMGEVKLAVYDPVNDPVGAKTADEFLKKKEDKKKPQVFRVNKTADGQYWVHNYQSGVLSHKKIDAIKTLSAQYPGEYVIEEIPTYKERTKNFTKKD